MFKVANNRIEIANSKDFNPTHILDCGQIFRYYKLSENEYKVLSQDKIAIIKKENNLYNIETNNIEYFINFFDLNTDYSKIKSSLYTTQFLQKCIDYGYGIRILKQDLFEIIIDFIISQNNNIPRIKKSIEYICHNFGIKISQEDYAFPTLESLKTADIEFFKKAGLGYRASYVYEFVQKITVEMLNDLKKMSTKDAKQFLLSFKGIGTKVANCILLFGLNKTDTFPVDTWIYKVYKDNFNGTLNSRLEIENFFIKTFQSLSGYAQQYMFYYKRELKGD